MCPSPFAWPGGKRALTPLLLKLLPEHRIYVEVFAGSAKLLFAKEPSRGEVMNDLNGDVTNFFRVAKHRPAELAERLQSECIHPERFRELRAAQPAPCELERAMRFAYLVWYSYGAKGEHYSQGSAASPCARPLTRVKDLLHAVAERLQAVKIEQQDFATILARYDSKATFFYLDPPYVDFQHNGRYEALPEDRRAELFQTLSAIKGRFLMSFDDHPEVRKLAAKHCMAVREEQVPYQLAGRAGERGKNFPELLLSNYPLSA